MRINVDCGALLRQSRSAERRRTPPGTTAQSKHFIIYADQNPKALARLRHAAREISTRRVRVLLRMDDPVIGDGNRLTVYVAADRCRRQQASLATPTGFLSGFYTRSGRRGSLALMSCEADTAPKAIPAAERVFYHEYSHHLMMQELDHPYPEWYVEGFAEYLSAPMFEHDGVGRDRRSAATRIGACWTNKSLPIDQVAGWDLRRRNQIAERAAAATLRTCLAADPLRTSWNRRGKANWTHYLARSIGRHHHLQPRRRPRSAISRALRQELNAYRQRSTLQYFKIPAKKINPRARRQSDR